MIRWENTSMNQSVSLTAEQWSALERGQEVRVTNPEKRMECVVIRADVYDRVKALLPDFDFRETYPAVDEVMGEDWNDPKMAEYDDYESRRQ
jgi:hypothetical protein